MKDTNIHECTQLSKFLSEYPDTSLHESLKILEESFPTHRAIKGDGNCFYRAFAFLYLSLSSGFTYHEVFPKVTWICKNSKDIISDDYFQEYLFTMWQKYIKPLWQITREEKETKLEVFWNEVYGFDEVMVGYFRSANYHHMKTFKDKFLPFASDRGFNYDLEKVGTFGAESEGYEINSLADVMKTRIMILCIDQDGFHPIDYMEHLENKGFYLFFRPGHYDIVYPSQSHKNTKSNKFSFSKIVQNFRGNVFSSLSGSSENNLPSLSKEKEPKILSPQKIKIVPSQKELGESKKDQFNKGAERKQDEKKYFYTTRDPKNEINNLGPWKEEAQQNPGNELFETPVTEQNNLKEKIFRSVLNNNFMTEAAGVALVILTITMVYLFQ